MDGYFFYSPYPMDDINNGSLHAEPPFLNPNTAIRPYSMRKHKRHRVGIQQVQLFRQNKNEYQKNTAITT